MQFHTRETEPDMGIEFLGLLVGVAGKVQDQDPATGLQDPEGAFNSALRPGCMV